MSEIRDDYDVLIAGGGPAGASAATHLARKGARVLVVEQARFPRAKLCGEFISPECLAHFARLGVMEEIEAARGAGIVKTVFYSPRGRRVAVPSEWFMGNDEARNGLRRDGSRGAVAVGLSRAEMDERLLRGARAAGAHVLEEAHAAGLIIENGRVCGARVKVNGKEERAVRARLTLDATGRARHLARRIESRAMTDGSHRAPSRRKRASLVAFKAHLEGARQTPGACEIYFYRGGYGGLNAVEGGLSNLCFIVAARAARAHASDAGRLMREVLMSNERAAESLRDARVVSEWLAVAIDGFGRREVAPAAGLLAIGDAASFIDPFTGSGMLLALESGELAANAIARWLEKRGTSEENFAALARDYRAAYVARFGARLRFCSLLRRAAFAPGVVLESAVGAAGASARLTRAMARATRRKALPEGETASL